MSPCMSLFLLRTHKNNFQIIFKYLNCVLPLTLDQIFDMTSLLNQYNELFQISIESSIPTRGRAISLSKNTIINVIN